MTGRSRRSAHCRRMNEEVENLVGPNPEQYTRILKLLKTRKEGEIEPYSRDDLYR